MKNKCIVAILFEYPLCNRYTETSAPGFKVNIYLRKVLYALAALVFAMRHLIKKASVGQNRVVVLWKLL